MEVSRKRRHACSQQRQDDRGTCAPAHKKAAPEDVVEVAEHPGRKVHTGAAAAPRAGPDVAQGGKLNESSGGQVKKAVDWKVVEQCLLWHPLDADVTQEYSMLFDDGLGDIITGTVVSYRHNGVGHELLMGQVRLFRPSYASIDGSVDPVSADDCYHRCITYNTFVCVDVIHTCHQYSPVLDVQHFNQTWSHHLAPPRPFEAVTGWLKIIHNGKFVELQHTKQGTSGEDKPRLRLRLDPVFHPGGVLETKFNNKKVVCVVDMQGALVVRVSLASATDYDNAQHDDRLVMDTEVTVNSQVPLFTLPAMLGVRSEVQGFGDMSHMHAPLAGSIIVNGISNQVQTTLQQSVNLPLVTRGKSGSKWSFEVECRSRRDTQPYNSTSTLTACVRRATGEVFFCVPNMGQTASAAAKRKQAGSDGPARTNNKPLEMPVEDVLAMLGVRTLKDLLAEVCGGQFGKFLGSANVEWLTARLQGFAAIEDLCKGCPNPSLEVAKQRYASKLRKPAQQVLDTLRRNFLPHCLSLEGKRGFAFGILRKMARAVVDGALDDRDRVRNKQLMGSGATFGVLTRQLNRTWYSEMFTELRKTMHAHKPVAATEIVSLRRYGSRINHHVNTGHFSTVDAEKKRNTLPSKIEGTNQQATRMQLHDVASTLANDNKNIWMRLMRGDGFPVLCPAKTPEGANTSINNATAVMTQTSKGVPLSWMLVIVEQLLAVKDVNVKAAGLASHKHASDVYVGDHLAGCVEDKRVFLTEFRRLRRRGVIPYCTSVCDTPEFGIMVRCNPGRPMTPLYIASEAHRVETVLDKLGKGENLFLALLKAGVVEILDLHEQDHCFIAMSRDHLTPRHTHSLIRTSAMLSATAAIIPFANHNQTPRVIYWTSQHKQAMGVHFMDEASTWSPTQLLSLMYPQRQIVRTQMEDIMWSQYSMPAVERMGDPDFADEVTGFCPVLAIAAQLDGIEDGIIMKKEAIERGMGAYVVVNNARILTPHHPDIQITRPPKSALRKKLADKDAYRHLEPNGLPRIGAHVLQGDVILGRTRITFGKTGNGSNEQTIVQTKCMSMLSRKEGIVKEVTVDTNQKGRIIKIRLEKLEHPIVGDKLSNRSGQKGVIVRIIPERDMPWSVHGIVPDLIFNSMGIVSRMTAAMLMEMVGCKAAAVSGKQFVDGSAFQFKTARQAVDVLGKDLADNGWDPMGNEVMFSGETGERLKGRMMMGPIHMMPLKHRAKWKAYARGRQGPRDPVTRQPKEGRQQDGGMRKGEMEALTFISHGTAKTSRELSSSDPYTAWVCTSCKQPSNPPPAALFDTGGTFQCSHCGMATMEPLEGNWTTYGMLNPMLAVLGIKMNMELQRKQGAAAGQTCCTWAPPRGPPPEAATAAAVERH